MSQMFKYKKQENHYIIVVMWWFFVQNWNLAHKMFGYVCRGGSLRPPDTIRLQILREGMETLPYNSNRQVVR